MWCQAAKFYVRLCSAQVKFSQVLLDDLIKNLFVRRAELIVRNFARRYPSDVAMFNLLRNALCNDSIEQRKMYRDVRVIMDDIRENISDDNSNGKLFPAFAYERLLFCFSRLDLSPDELPQEPSCFVCRPTADHKSVALPNECGYYFCHKSLPFGKGTKTSIGIADTIRSAMF